MEAPIEEVTEEAVEETTPDESVEEVVEAVAETASDEPVEEVAETPAPPQRNLRDLLNDLRQVQQASQTASSSAVNTNSSRGPRGFNPSDFGRPGTGDGMTTATGPTSSNPISMLTGSDGNSQIGCSSSRPGRMPFHD
ncbi:hypothetical protein NDI52_32970 [Leptolyngbya sp. PL-A3]|uniref:hypothetical protein n=1 Tax=Leptolyngbya sp. PL-A3 TaxID=2933911 RepID=UPI003296A5E5